MTTWPGLSKLVSTVNVPTPGLYIIVLPDQERGPWSDPSSDLRVKYSHNLLRDELETFLQTLANVCSIHWSLNAFFYLFFPFHGGWYEASLVLSEKL